MDEIRLIEAWIVTTLGGVIGLGFLYVRRVVGGPTARFWAWAWFSFFLSLFATISPDVASTIIAHAFGTGFPTLLLAGALSFAARSIPRWLIGFGFGVGVLRGIASASGFAWIADGGVWLVEAPMNVVAAAVLWQASRSKQRTPAVAALSVFYAVFAALEITNLRFIAHTQEGSFGYFALGGLATLLLANTQVLVLIERARVNHARDLELLRDIAIAGTVERDVEAVVERSLELIRERLELDAGAVWRMQSGSHGMRCVHDFGLRGEMPEDLAEPVAARPLVQQVLATGEAIFLDDIQADSLPVHPWYVEMGIHTGAVLPLQYGGEDLGFMTVGRLRVRPFNAAERRILMIATEELSLSLHHVSALERSEERQQFLSSVIATSPTGILIADRNHRIETLNATFAHHFGESAAEPWIGKSIGSFGAGVGSRVEDPEELARVFMEVECEAPARTTPLTLVKPDERELLLFTGPIASDAGEFLGRVWVTRDVTEERRLEEQLRQSQRLETLGTLAGGVAHDFNNQLMAILGNARLLQGAQPDEAIAVEAARDIQRAAEHCADLTRSLLAFARRASLALRPIDPTKVLEELRTLLRSILPSTLQVEFVAARDLPTIQADPTQLQQILLNLVVNARDAVRADGRIRIDVRERTVEEPTADEVKPGRYVEFSVSDDGTGMDARTRRRVFDPFFTTKPLFEGTGLGLAVVYGAARAHQGWVEVDSSPGVGSTFRVLIPVAEVQQAEASTLGPPPLGRGEETILLADDEEILRRIVRLSLEQQGYRVIEARDGREAFEAFITYQREIDLVLLDVTMPELDGLSVLEKIREVAPRMPTIMSSGLPEPEGSWPSEESTSFLPKPYEFDLLFELVRTMIDRAARNAAGSEDP